MPFSLLYFLTSVIRCQQPFMEFHASTQAEAEALVWFYPTHSIRGCLRKWQCNYTAASYAQAQCSQPDTHCKPSGLSFPAMQVTMGTGIQPLNGLAEIGGQGTNANLTALWQSLFLGSFLCSKKFHLFYQHPWKQSIWFLACHSPWKTNFLIFISWAFRWPQYLL